MYAGASVHINSNPVTFPLYRQRKKRQTPKASLEIAQTGSGRAGLACRTGSELSAIAQLIQ